MPTGVGIEEPVAGDVMASHPSRAVEHNQGAVAVQTEAGIHEGLDRSI